jgi:hypothetical protein
MVSLSKFNHVFFLSKAMLESVVRNVGELRKNMVKRLEGNVNVVMDDDNKECCS